MSGEQGETRRRGNSFVSAGDKERAVAVTSRKRTA
jgi:hypothetical protein